MEAIFKSRITQLNPSIGTNTHEIVINRLIELWQSETEESRKLFNDVAERLAKYDNPVPPTIYYDNSRLSFRCIVTDKDKTKNKTLFRHKDRTIVLQRRAEWLKFNR